MTLRAFLLSLVLLSLGSVWLEKAELITFAANLSNAVPPIQALAGLILLRVLNALLKRWLPRFALTQGEMTVMFIFLCAAMAMMSLGILRFFFPALTALRYFATPENKYGELTSHLPSWFAPSSEEAVRRMYEGANGQVPWDVWLTPLVAWGVFFLLFFFVMWCLLALFYRHWTENERLTFPLVDLALQVSGDDAAGTPLNLRGGGLSLIRGGGASSPHFFRSPLMWTGFGISFAFNAINIAHTFNPSVPALGLIFNLGSLFTERPWSAIQPLRFYYRPEFFGFGYFVPLEVGFSIWFFYLLERLLAIGASIVGYEKAGFPFEVEQSLGAYLAVALCLVWTARRTIAARNARRPLIGLGVGIVALCAWCSFAGLSVWVAFVYLAFLLLIALTYTRVRAETGMPAMWLFPFGQAKAVMMNALGSAAFAGSGMGSLTIFSTLFFLSRGYFPSTMAYQLEGMRMGQASGVRGRDVALAVFGGLLIGYAMGAWTHLQAYYTYGANVLEGGTVQGGYRVQEAQREFQLLAGYAQRPVPPDLPRTLASGTGFFVALILMLLRWKFLRFPLHPLGYGVATSYGYVMWGSLLAAWLIKLVVLRLGGVRLYRQLAPLFLGIALGHFFTLGIVWGFAAIFYEEQARMYHVDIG
jgi:hypothetical protein